MNCSGKFMKKVVAILMTAFALCFTFACDKGAEQIPNHSQQSSQESAAESTGISNEENTGTESSGTESESDSATDEDAGQSGGEQLPTPVPPITNGGGFDFN